MLQEFLNRGAPSPLAAAVDMARALNADGPNFKRGYPMESAYIVVVESARRDGFKINEQALGEALGIEPAAERTRLIEAARYDADGNPKEG